VENIMSSKLFTTRQGTVLLGVIAAVIAAIALIVYLQHYRSSIVKPPVDVLVAQKLIQQGTPGDVIRTTAGYYAVRSIPEKQVETGAIVSPASLAGKVALTDIAGGQQLTAADFGAGGGVANELNSNQRAVVVPLGSPQEVGGQISAGSLVDVWVSTTGQSSNGVSTPVVRELFQGMYVLTAGTNGGNVTLRATPTQAGQLIWASQNAEIWLVLRPTIASTQHKPPVISAGQVTGH
jgi:Flp pilus assembly protein CpaB